MTAFVILVKVYEPWYIAYLATSGSKREALSNEDVHYLYRQIKSNGSTLRKLNEWNRIKSFFFQQFVQCMRKNPAVTTSTE